MIKMLLYEFCSDKFRCDLILYNYNIIYIYWLFVNLYVNEEVNEFIIIRNLSKDLVNYY